MANFDMIPPDANELFGFNGPPGDNGSKINWLKMLFQTIRCREISVYSR